MITLTIDGMEIKTSEGKTVFQAAREAGIYIPNLCVLRYMKMPVGACRLCLVEVEGEKGPVGSCTLPAKEGMIVQTNTPKLVDLRRKLMKNILGRHPSICLTCHRPERCQPGEVCLRKIKVGENHCVTCPNSGHCEFQTLVDHIGVEEQPAFAPRGLVIEPNPFIIRNNNVCVMCGRCVWACQEMVGARAIGFQGTGRDALIKPTSTTLMESGCYFCGSCVEVCPTGALLDREEEEGEAWENRVAMAVRCQHTCPANVDVPRFVRFIVEGKYAEALAVNRENVPFAGILGHVCAHPCEAACRRNRWDKPVSIRALKRFAWEKGGASAFEAGSKALASGKKVAVVGSGPAGLTAAYYLAKKGGHAVTIFEAMPQAGGMLRAGIPEMRLPRKVLDDEIGIVTRLGVEIKTNTKVESVDKLLQEGYQAIFIAIGAHSGTRLGIEGEDSEGVIEGLAFLRAFNTGEKPRVGDRVAVVGGGNAAFDSARIARRLGAKEVTIIYPGTRPEIAASDEEVEEALEEGIKLELMATPTRIEKSKDGLSIQCGRKDSNIPVTLPADTIIIAMGQLPALPDQMGLSLQDGGTLKVNSETLQTSRQGVFAGGDAVRGPSTVIRAIADGRKAAVAIDKYLGGSGNIEESLAPPMPVSAGRDEGFAKRQRVAVPVRAAAERSRSFEPVEIGYSQEQATEESKRCMGCSRRFLIGAMLAGPELPARRAQPVPVAKPAAKKEEAKAEAKASE